MTTKPKRIIWTTHSIAEAKAQARTQITSWRANHTSDLVLNKILDRIEFHNKSTNAESSLNCFIFCISALVHHEKFGGLPVKQMEEIKELAAGILQAAGKYLKASPLASLQSDLHIVQSQIFRKSGDHWSAAWEQHFALRAAGDRLSGGIAFHKYVMGNRLMRMGHSRLALMHYASAEQETGDSRLSNEQIERIKINKITIDRISGKLTEARSQIKKAMAEKISEAFALELTWEEACCDVQSNCDARKIADMVKPDKSHYSPGYLIESVLWGLCLKTRKDLATGPSLESLRRNKKLKIRELGVLFEIAATIQQGYNHSIPLETRLRQMRALFSSVSEVVSVDIELLIWVAATRCLARLHASELAVLCLAKYEALSMTLSNGSCRDGLGVAADLFEFDWYKDQQPSAA